jgi:hypothetical protein
MAHTVRLPVTYFSNEGKRGCLMIKRGGGGYILIVYYLRTTKVHNSLNFTLLRCGDSYYFKVSH